jgi:hypothetical protein
MMIIADAESSRRGKITRPPNGQEFFLVFSQTIEMIEGFTIALHQAPDLRAVLRNRRQRGLRTRRHATGLRGQ